MFLEVLGKKRHASEQTIRATPQPELAALSQDDLGLREKGKYRSLLSTSTINFDFNLKSPLFRKSPEQRIYNFLPTSALDP
jgi:hypothetical protein